ncbi:hypothetical protein DSM3645_28407 [Blastopirellula marina DSM 3645]|uniref:Uncharacterized protein n=1 Tax=Blastopirellula marina DSM 3645 TaxID=314230 RepID=A3ZPA3_9BACT|nr:hypothetical protein DSM3645_28407 [Blastopirellula marina DSM 3645]
MRKLQVVVGMVGLDQVTREWTGDRQLRRRARIGGANGCIDPRLAAGDGLAYYVLVGRQCLDDLEQVGAGDAGVPCLPLVAEFDRRVAGIALVASDRLNGQVLFAEVLVFAGLLAQIPVHVLRRAGRDAAFTR